MKKNIFFILFLILIFTATARAEIHFPQKTKAIPVPTLADKEPVTFSIEIPGIKTGQLGETITIYIDGKPVGKISNFNNEYDASIDIQGFPPGVHQYKLKIKVYTFRGFQPFYYRTITAKGSITVEGNDVFVTANGTTSPHLMK